MALTSCVISWLRTGEDIPSWFMNFDIESQCWLTSGREGHRTDLSEFVRVQFHSLWNSRSRWPIFVSCSMDDRGSNGFWTRHDVRSPRKKRASLT
ncbi:unnamed protein product, partial [Mycena citricolor]